MPLGETGDEGVEAIKSGLDTFEPGLEVIDDLVQDLGDQSIQEFFFARAWPTPT